MQGALIQMLFMVAVIMGGFLVMVFAIRQRTANKILCWFLEADKTAIPRLLKKASAEMIIYEGDRYGYEEEVVRWVRYPSGFPAIFQVVIPCILYQRGRYSPLNWIELGQAGASSKEVGAVLEPHWMANIVRGTREGTPVQTRWDRFGPMLTLGIAALTFVMMLFIISKILAIESTLDVLK